MATDQGVISRNPRPFALQIPRMCDLIAAKLGLSAGLSALRFHAFPALLGSRENKGPASWANADNIVSMAAACGELVLAQGSVSDSSVAPLASISCTMLSKSREERASRSILTTASTSPWSSAAMARANCSRSAFTPLIFSLKTLTTPAVISFRLADEDLKVLDEACLLFNENRSQVVGGAIRSLLTEYVREDGKLIRQPYWMPNLDGKFNAS